MDLERGSVTVPEPPAFVPCLDDVAVMGQTVEQCRGHLGVGEYTGPFTEGQVRGDNDRGLFIKAADHMEQQLSARLGKWQISQFVEDDKVQSAELFGQPTRPCRPTVSLKPVDQVHHVEEPATPTCADAAPANGRGQVGFAGTCAPHKHDITLEVEEFAPSQVTDKGFVDGRIRELKVLDILCPRHPGNGHLVAYRPGLLFMYFGLEQFS